MRAHWRIHVMTRLGMLTTACLLALPLPALGQDAAISGTVADQTGGVLPGVTVEAASPALAGAPRVAVTDGEGRYSLDGLPPGEYTVSFTLSGFQTEQRSGVTVAGSDGATLDAMMQFASFSEDVTVVGSKLDTGRQEFGTSVAYLSAEQIDVQAIFTVEDAFDRTANAFTGTASLGAYSIRGVNNNGITPAFSSANALASVLVNQTALSPTSGDFLKPSLFDASSVEILRGPQSTLQGPNSLIGSVLINYNQPTFDGYAGRVRFEGGGFGTMRTSVMQNIELVDDILAARVTYENRQADGAVTNVVHDVSDVQRTDEQTVRLQLGLRPGADDRTSINLTWLHNDSDSNPFALVAPNPMTGAGLFDRQQNYSRLDEYPFTFDLVNVEATAALTDRVSLTSVTGYSAFDLDQGFDGDLTQFDFLNVDAFVNDTLVSQEVRATYAGDAMDAIVGLFISQGDYGNGFSGAGIFPDGMGGVAPFSSRTDLLEEVNQLAVFGRGEWTMGDRLLATAGLRLNRETRKTDSFADNNGFVSELAGEETFQQLIPSASLSYSITPDTSVGASYARGFQAGGIAFAVFLGQAQSYGEEFTNNYEVFLRHRSADGRITLNANVFSIDWFDQQVPFTPPGGFPQFDQFIANVGESNLQGFEVETEVYISRDLQVFGSLGVTDSTFKDFILDGVDLSGREFPASPGWNASLGVAWQPAAGWFAGSTVNFTDGAYTEIFAPDITRLSPRELLSGRFGYRFSDGWSIYAWGTNLLDDEYELGLFDGRQFGLPGAYGRLGDPRTVGVGIDLDW
ncbi:MAG: TonB-dependent receptor [Acidobacteria bacterium]|nr:TonB-dependent receptor [Acidobacteriota bacterium]